MTEYIVSSDKLPTDGELKFDFNGTPEESTMFWNGERLAENRGAYYLKPAAQRCIWSAVRQLSLWLMAVRFWLRIQSIAATLSSQLR
ncbi:MAG: hypothetical protein QNJ14_11820 [Woeseiaceae bacterium]|nr:hypothetical protein [Woeseiaceae bacterium]